jgi:hypothetical protein
LLKDENMKSIDSVRSRALFIAAVVSTAALGAGCAHTYTYEPVGPGSAGGPAAQYPVPPTYPQGAVYITSFGFTDFDNGQGGGQRLLHARVAVSNGSPTTWEVDGRQQYLAAPGLQPQPPSFMNTNAGQGPVYPIAPGAANVFDLYFTLPPGYGQPENLGAFALDWSVNAGGQVVAQQTSFERYADVAYSYATYPPYVYVGLGFGFGWWYAPFYPYRHYPPIIHGYYYAPGRAWGGPYRGPPPGGWRGGPGGGWRAVPPSGGWRAPAAGGWRGAPVGPRSAPVRGGWHGGGRHR